MVQALTPLGRQRRTVIIFSRWPHFGQGKRRLAATQGEGVAYRFQCQQMRALSARQAGSLAGDRRWSLLWALDRPFPQGRLPGRVFAQGRGDLGQRMQGALQRALALSGRGTAVVLVGSDIPDLRADHIATAFALLRRADLVYGPALDGGFWLVGWSGSRRLPCLFQGIGWSRDDTLDRSIDRLRGLGRYRFALADRLADVDFAVNHGKDDDSRPNQGERPNQ